jgi:hypothetical protein
MTAVIGILQELPQMTEAEAPELRHRCPAKFLEKGVLQGAWRHGNGLCDVQDFAGFVEVLPHPVTGLGHVRAAANRRDAFLFGVTPRRAVMLPFEEGIEQVGGGMLASS